MLLTAGIAPVSGRSSIPVAELHPMEGFTSAPWTLDTCGHADCGGNKYLVSTSPAKDRAAGTGRWRVFAESSSPTDSKVREGDLVHLLNGYDDWNGGFLDTCGGGPTGGKYGVSTSGYINRSEGTGTWKVSKAT